MINGDRPGQYPAMNSLAAAAGIAADLRRAGLADVAATTLDRALYSSDASLYRVVPAAVVRPRHRDEVAAALAVCRTAGVPVTCRGAGTSIAGNAVGAGVILDFRRHLNQIGEIDPEERLATVAPGVVHAQLQRAARPLGLRFGPDPSTHDRCTIGGMIGNNACGTRALAYGRTSDNVRALDLLTADGRTLRLESGRGAPEDPRLDALRRLVAGSLATIRTEFGRFGRQVSGYSLEHLLPERGFDVARAIAGSEGTLGIVTSATVRLVPEPGHPTLVILGYPDMASAADAAPGLLRHQPTACDGLDARIVQAVRERRGQAAVPDLPRGAGWLFVEFTGASAAEAGAAASAVAADSGALESLVVTDPPATALLWRIRQDGAGLSGRTLAGEPAYPGWEDSAVPPGRLGGYLRDLEELLGAHGLTGLPYGHFGDGCVHLRLDFPFRRSDGRAVLRAFLRDAAALVVSHGGSLSGEHGDGRARSELLPLMYSPAALELFAQVKTAFDPKNLLNPGVLVAPRPVDADLRYGPDRQPRERLALAYRHDHASFGAAVHRCTGVGKCLAGPAPASVMCPSYQATREEKDSTRGRARVLQEMINGTLVTGGWRAPEVRAALDLCLSCKACSSECPAGVDMASYKAEVLYQAYRHRPRPRSHYALGQLPRWARLASRAPALANAMLMAWPLARLARVGAGIDQRRGLPPFAATTFRTWFTEHQAERRQDGNPVLLWADTFTNHFSPQAGVAAVTVLEDAGFRVTIPDGTACCALTWISTGQLSAARRILGRTSARLLPAAEAGVPIVGLEPSCVATLRSDSAELLGTPAARTVAAATRTLSELLATAGGWDPPRLDGIPVVAQPHCHHLAVMGWDADAALLRRAGADLTQLGGCCGLAGNFGAERGHYEISAAIAESSLLPAVRQAPGAVVLADGFSCRRQLADLADRKGIHLAQLLAAALAAKTGQ